MKERDYIISLYEIYCNLLTLNQRKYFEDYYFEDLSLSEIGENNKVSRSYVSKTVNTVAEKLKFFESTLKIYDTREKIRNISKKVKEKEGKQELENLF